jgi:hypothetical protein
MQNHKINTMVAAPPVSVSSLTSCLMHFRGASHSITTSFNGIYVHGFQVKRRESTQKSYRTGPLKRKERVGYSVPCVRACVLADRWQP